METYGLPASGYCIFLDRFARKDIDRKTLAVGDFVLAIPDQKSGRREIGRIVEKNDHSVVVEVGDNGTTRKLSLSVDSIDKPLELSPQEMYKRVAKAISSVEKEPARWQGEFEQLLRYFVPGGRILTAAGVEEKLTCFNCFVMPYPDDSIEGIFQRAIDLAATLRRGGGVGIPLAKLRPRGSYVRTVNGRSSGPVSWSAIYSTTTGLIEQGGSRKGALMLILDDWHPDIEEFIESKRDMRFNTNSNQSVAISDDLMHAVDKDEDWQLVFPDVRHPAYDTQWTGDIKAWKAKFPKAVVVYKTIKARELWDQIVESAYASGEPGLWFKDKTNAMSNSYYYEEGELNCTNPCAEQPLPANGVCNLGHLILPRFVSGCIGEAQINWELLGEQTEMAVRFLDDVIDYSHYFDEATERQQKSERRVGMGTTGLAELLIRCGITYGANAECKKFLDKLYGFIATKAYEASVELAKEKGVFLWCDPEKLANSGFMQSMPPEVRDLVRENGLRNVTLLTQAPCGSVGSYLGTSAGIEPYFDFKWTRDVRAGKFQEVCSVVDEYYKDTPGAAGHRLPDYFVTAQTMSPADHAHTQAGIQRWVDSAISKTSNLPADYPVEKVGEFYRLLHDLGCKGGTVYRDGSRDSQVLTPEAKKDVASVPDTGPDVAEIPYDVVVPAWKIKVKTPMGAMHVIVAYNEGGTIPRESFAHAGKGGSDVYADIEGLDRLVSFILRMNSSIPSDKRLALVAKSLAGIGGRHQEGFGDKKVLSLPDGLARAFRLIAKNGAPVHSFRESADQSPKDYAGYQHGIGPDRMSEPDPRWELSDADYCVECQGGRFIPQEGCRTCQDCGNSEC